MCKYNLMENSKTPFVEEIDYSEIELLEVIGKGSFGVVNKGKWRGKFVAIKKIEGETEKKAFLVERQQLSRVNHPNIVKLYGACTKSPVCLVMEYAEGGSLYNVLHLTPTAHYTATHAMSWALQCANGVSYLHNMKPKALIHRDLKPPNLLLIMGGTVLKICDFGTACDIQTHMTNSKGSAAWMAPEVFEGRIYSEKCDVFSWGIILWEVLTRRTPFSGSAYSIMWAVHSGRRPPFIEGCPMVLEKLMTRCWDKIPQQRPSMSEVVETMTELFKYFKGADEPITFSATDDESSEKIITEEEFSSEVPSVESLTSPPVQSPTKQNVTAVVEPLTSKWVGKPITPSLMEPISVEVEDKFTPAPIQMSIMSPNRQMSQTSAPPSLASSQENLNLSVNKESNLKRLSADFSRLANSELKLEQISDDKKSSSYGSLINKSKPLIIDDPSKKINIPKVERRSQSPVYTTFAPTKPGFTSPTYQSPISSQHNCTNLGFYHQMLEPQYQPLDPFPNSSESMKVFEEHNKLAQEYIRVQAERSLLLKRRQELNEELSKELTLTSGIYTEADKYVNEMLELQTEKQSLESLYDNLKIQLDILKNKPKQRNSGDWVMIP